MQCGEEKPECERCIQFGVQCSFASGVPIRSEPPPAPAPIRSEQCLSEVRGRGRPRNNWTTNSLGIDGASPASTFTIGASSAVEEPPRHPRLNVEDAELLLHFVQFTSYTLSGSREPEHPMTRFWTHNLPRIGLAHPFVMHLAYAVAGYHLAHGVAAGEKDEGRRAGLRELAERHAAEGLRQFTAALAHLDDANCGAAYISATLVCYCTFAAGPSGPGDLLVCNLDRDGPGGSSSGSPENTSWFPLIHGLRLILEMFSTDVVFSGLMDPFHPTTHERYKEEEAVQEMGPRCTRECFARLDWEQPLSKLREFVATYDEGIDIGDGDEENNGRDKEGVCLRSLEGLIAIYRATYGDSDGNYDGLQDYQHVFGWIYRMGQPFLARLRARDPRALVMIAYYAVLFQTMDFLWFLDGWKEHLLTRVRGLLPEEYTSWLEWPIKMTGVVI